MKICYSPYNKKAMEQNKYIYQISDSMEKAGVEVLSVRETFNSFKNLKKVKVFNLNWFENIYDESRFQAFKRYFLKSLFLLLLKILNKKIIWTVHNKIPHDSNNKQLSIKMMRRLAKMSNVIITHCEDTNQELIKLTQDNGVVNKIKKINHPNYLGIYNEPSEDIRLKYKIDSSEVVLLFLGQIKPYKNIELIIKVAKHFKDSKMKFLIAGKCVDEGYKEELLELIKNSGYNIIPIFRFIENDEIPNFMQACDAVLLPYDINSSLNSGAAFLAFSFGKTVICPKIGTINDIDSFENLYSYSYESNVEHVEEVIKQIKKILENKSPRYTLSNQGSNLLGIMKKRYSVSRISKEYKVLIEQTLKRRDDRYDNL